MTVSKLNWKKLSGVIVLAGGLLFYSCDNKKTEKNSTATEIDTAAVNNTTVTSGDTSGRTTKMSRGKVSVTPAIINTTEKQATDKLGYYNYAEVSPAFDGGQGAIESYITNNIEYPEEAIDNGIEGTINVQFGIDENGNISNVKTLGSKIGYGLEEEAIKVISAMPKWTPGTVKGKKVKTWMVLPISYRLEG